MRKSVVTALLASAITLPIALYSAASVSAPVPMAARSPSSARPFSTAPARRPRPAPC
ncbi:hypothetical protein ACFSUK_31675 [Sphingobium scionense]